MSNSKYTIYYDELISRFKSKLINMPYSPALDSLFFSPSLFKLIHEKLYLMPIWSGVMIRHTAIVSNNEFLRGITRLDNNPVENHFGHTKVNELLKRKVYPSEHVVNEYKRVKSKYVENYSKTFKNNSEIRKSNLAMDTFEKWNKKSN
jgi:hypothetical protein